MRFVSKNGEDSVKVLDIMLFKIHEFKKEDDNRLHNKVGTA